MIRRTPATSAIIVLSLAIGIGANTAIFSVADALLLRPLSYSQADRIVHIWLRSPGLGIQQDWPSPGEYLDIKNQNRSFDELAISLSDTFVIAQGSQATYVEGFRTSSGLFRLFGAKTIVGQTLTPAQDIPGDRYKAVITYGLWKRLFAEDRSIVGKQITLSGHPVTVVGVLEPGFSLSTETMPPATQIDNPEIFIPLPLGPDAIHNRSDENYNVTGRLKPGVTLQQAQADVAGIAARIREQDRRDPTFTMTVVPLLEQIVGGVRRVILILFVAIGLVLVIACANVANLLLSRALTREREMAVRAALGSGRGRLIRQMLAESLMLSAAGGVCGLLLASLLMTAMRAMRPGNIPRVDEIGMSGAVLAFTFAVSVLTGFAFGAFPALRISRADINSLLKAGGRGLKSGAASDRLRNALVVGELALSLILLIGAGLLLRSFLQLQKVPPGFDPEHVLSSRVTIRGVNFPTRTNVIRFLDTLHDRVSALPGVVSEGATSAPPLSGSLAWAAVQVEGYSPPPDRPELQVDLRSIEGDYFRTMRIPLLRGRVLTLNDTTDAPRVAVVDRTLANRFWPGENALGKRIRFTRDNDWLTIVGVVGSVRHEGLDTEPRMTAYMPYAQYTIQNMYVVTRTSGDPLSAAAAVRREIRALDASVPVYGVETMQDTLFRSMARQRFSATVLSAFALFAIILASVGVYGVISFMVAQSTHDIGVMMSLGAEPGDIHAMVMKRGMTLFGISLALGLSGAFALTRLMNSMLFGVSDTDPLTFAVIPALLALVALAACYVPARRASFIDPIVALRED